MKRKIIAILLVLAMAVCIFPASAFAANETSAPVAPLSTNSAPPSDFHFVYQISGNTKVDAVIDSVATAAVLCAIGYLTPVGGIISFLVGISPTLAELYSQPQTLQGDYIKYVYRPDDPFLYPSVDSWVRMAFYADVNQDGVKEYIGEYCYYDTIVLPRSADLLS